MARCHPTAADAGRGLTVHRRIQPFDCWCFAGAAGLLLIFYATVYAGAVKVARIGDQRRWSER